MAFSENAIAFLGAIAKMDMHFMALLGCPKIGLKSLGNRGSV
ncbi:hypothetical protein [Tolypothrix sp. FACHB-123]|nr:hypothetical protein [Tolypothrix sp. FACHB-123]